MKKPVRIQLRRTKGWRLQEASRAVNGLPAVKVDRTTRYGNPYKVGRKYFDYGLMRMVTITTTAQCIELFRGMVAHNSTVLIEWIKELRGRNLACWCKPGQPCHADVLLELVNG